MKKTAIIGAILLAAGVMSVPAADVAANWEQHCTKCHGADGKGETKMGKKAGAKDYTDAKVQAEIKDDAAFKAVKDGLKGDDGKEKMKAYADKLSDDEIKALIAHVRTFKK